MRPHDDAEAEYHLETGMHVVDPDARPLGPLESILVEDDTGLGRFLVVEGRLLPVEIIEDVSSGRVHVDVPRDRLQEFPEVQGECPTLEQMRRSYERIGLPGPLPEGP